MVLLTGESFRLGFCKCHRCNGKVEIPIASFGLLRRYKLNHHLKRGKDSPHWRGGRILVDGYWYLHLPGHPYATRREYYLEHRKVMEDYLGRYLDPLEVVHHVDGDRQNNKLENLKLYSSHGEHMGTEHNPKQDFSNRSCEQCGSVKSGKTRKDGKIYDKWLLNSNGNGFLCLKCYDKNRWLEKNKKRG